MALNLKALAQTAANIGFSLAGSTTTGAGRAIVVTTGAQTGAYNAATDSVATSGGTVSNCTALEYSRKHDEQPDTQISDKKVATETKVWMIKAAELPAGAKIDRNTPITAGGERWWVLKAEPDPTGAIWIVDVGR